MKIAYITTGNIYTNSSANIRNIALVKGLEELGNNVHVLCFSNNKADDESFVNDLKDSNVYCIGKIEKKNLPNPSPKHRPDNIFARIKSYVRQRLLYFYRHFQIYDPYKHKITEIDKNVFDWNDFDVCISSSDPKSSHLLVYNAKKRGYKFKWIQYWGDPMTLDLTNKSWVAPLLNKEEEKLFSCADYIVLTNQAAKVFLENKYSYYSSKFISIPTSFFYNNKLLPTTKNKLDHIVVGYYGGCRSLMRNIVPLTEAINNNGQYQLIVAGGNDIGLKTNEKITVYDRISPSEMFKLIEKTDILVVLENRPKNANEPCKQVPGKMYHYALLGKPVLVICETDSLRKEFGRFDVYYFCQNDEKEILKAIETISNDLTHRVFKPVEEFLPSNVASILINKINKM
jgi:hypothetical protein